MESPSDFIGLIIVFCAFITLLNVILFFKIWGMTNDTYKIKNILQEWLDIEHPEIVDEDQGNRKQQTKEVPKKF